MDTQIEAKPAPATPDQQVAASVAARMVKEGMLDQKHADELATKIAAGKASSSEWLVFFRGCLKKKEEKKS